jgi:hypothetical protein
MASGIADPEAVVGGDVHDGVAAMDGVAEGAGFEEIADDSFCMVRSGQQAFDVGEVAGAAGEEAEVRAAGGELAGDVASYESSGAGEEDLHNR